MPPVMRVIWRSPATPRPADPVHPTRVGPDRPGPAAEMHESGVRCIHCTQSHFRYVRTAPAGQPAFLQSAAKPSESRLAPPTRAPSTSGCDISSATFFAFTDPP